MPGAVGERRARRCRGCRARAVGEAVADLVAPRADGELAFLADAPRAGDEDAAQGAVAIGRRDGALLHAILHAEVIALERRARRVDAGVQEAAADVRADAGLARIDLPQRGDAELRHEEDRAQVVAVAPRAPRAEVEPGRVVGGGEAVAVRPLAIETEQRIRLVAIVGDLGIRQRPRVVAILARDVRRHADARRVERQADAAVAA